MTRTEITDNRTKVSYSQYSIWAGCPQNWKLQYIDGHKDDSDSIHTVFGTAMHEVLQDWLTLLYSGKENLARSMDLDDAFKDKLREGFQNSIVIQEDGTKKYVCTKAELEKFFTQGTQILSYVQSNYKKLFPHQNVELVGVEYPLVIEVRPGIWYTGYIDILTRNTKTGKMVIYDLKTSRRGWTQKEKTDKVKLSQLLLYKKFVSETMNVPLEDISVEYIILKRELIENSMYPIPRVSSFQPSHGKPSVNNAWIGFQRFLDECFTPDAQRTADKVKPAPSKETCRWCKFRTQKDLCPDGIG